MRFYESKNMISIEPALNEKTGAYKINVLLTDSMGAERTYTFKVEVISEEET